MSLPSIGTPESRLRAAVALRVQQTSRRRVASEIGLSPRGVWKFLQGARPHPQTRQKLERWYQDVALEEEGVSYVEALHVLIESIPPEYQSQAVAELAAFLQDLHARFGAALPRQLETVRTGVVRDVVD